MSSAGSSATRRASAFSSTADSPNPGRAVRRVQSCDRRAHRRRHPGVARRHRRGGHGGAKGAAEVGGALRLWAGEASLCAGAARAEARALSRGAGDDRQRQTDPRVARHRRAPGRPPLLSPRRLGLAGRQRVSGHASRRRLRADHPVEFPAPDARLEDRAGARRRQFGRAEACRIHAADGARLCGDLRRGRAARRASSIS